MDFIQDSCAVCECEAICSLQAPPGPQEETGRKGSHHGAVDAAERERS